MANPSRRGAFSPQQVAAAWRAEHPKLFDAFDDARLLDAIKAEDPETYALIDPSLIGLEVLEGPPTPPPGFPAPRAADRVRGAGFNLPPGPGGPPAPPRSKASMAIGTGLRVVPAVAGSFVSAVPLIGSTVGAVTGAGGELAGQAWERLMGERDRFEPRTMAIEGALNAVPLGGFTRNLSRLGRMGVSAATGAGLGGTSAASRVLLEEERIPTLQDVALPAALGAGFGGVVQGAAEGVNAARTAANAVGGTDFSLPTAVPPPTYGARASHALEVQRLQEAISQTEAAEIAREFAQKGWTVPKDTRYTLSYAQEAKDYLEELARLQLPPVPVPDLPPTLPTAGPYDAPPQRALPAAAPIEVFPADAPAPPVDVLNPAVQTRPRIQMPSTLDRLTDELDRGVSAGALEGPPRLVTQPTDLSLTPPPAPRGRRAVTVPEDTRLPFPEGPPAPPGPLRQSRTTFEEPLEGQPRLANVDRPQPLDRTYPEGPNAGPRREGELHGQPRTIRRQVAATGGGVRYETAPTKLQAEDPAVYPADVRRELATMAYELDMFRHERFAGGNTAEQIDAMVRSGVAQDASDAIAQLRRSGATAGGAIAGAPVYHEVIEAAAGSYPHVTRAKMLEHLRGALLEGKGSGLTDAAAQVARRRLALRQQGEGVVKKSTIVAQRGDEGDDLIGWVDPDGVRALPAQDTDEWTRMTQELSTDELRGLVREYQQYGQDMEALGGEALRPAYQAAIREAERRGVVTPRQQGMQEFLGSEGGAIQRDLLTGEDPDGPPSFERRVQQEADQWRPPTLRVRDPEGPPSPRKLALEAERQAIERRYLAGEEDVPLPGLEQVRETEIPTPTLTEEPFTLTPPPARPGTPGTPGTVRTGTGQPGLFDRLKGEAGVLVLDVPSGDRPGLKRWLKKQEAEYGGEAWFARVEQAIEDGDWNRAWKAAAAASVRSYAKASAAAKTPGQERQIAAAVRGTPLQDDLSTQIVATGRGSVERSRPAPRVSDFPPSTNIRVRQGGQGMTLGPAGILNPGPPTLKPPRSLRSQRLDEAVIEGILEAADENSELFHLVKGNRDSMLRLFRQITDAVVNKELGLDPRHFEGLTAEEIGRQYMATLSEAGRILGKHGNFVQAHADDLLEFNNRMDMGAARRGTLKEGGPPGRPIQGARGRPISKEAAEVLDRIAEESHIPEVDRALLVNDLQKPTQTTTADTLVNSQYPFLTAGFATAVRNVYTTVGRYSWELLDHALTIPNAYAMREPEQARQAMALIRERFIPKRGFAVSPRRALSTRLEDIYDITQGTLSQLSPSDARRTLNLLNQYPDEAAHLIGMMGGEDVDTPRSPHTILNKITDPRLQRILTIWNRSQEFTWRGLTFDTALRAQLRAAGHDPNVLLSKSVDEVRQALPDAQLQPMLDQAVSAALEMTWAGRLANRSIPGALVHAVNNFWPAKLVQRFPRFNFSAAPRWIYDHSPAAILDLIRLPFDAQGVTSTGKYLGGGRLYRGLKAQRYQTDVIPKLKGEISQAQGRLGVAVRELQETSREWSIRQRQVRHLQDREQQGLPGVATQLQEAQELRDQLMRRRDRLKDTLRTEKTTIQDLSANEKKLWAEVQNATGINAPTWSSWMARMTSGYALLGAAMVMRSQEGARGTKFYEFKVDRGEGQDPWKLDLRSAAPFVQYLFVADVILDLQNHTDWDAVKAEVQGYAKASPAQWQAAMWRNYEGKYTQQNFSADFAQAFLSISRAAGTTLTITDLVARNGWSNLSDAGNAIMGTIGEFLGGYAVPLGQFKDLAAAAGVEGEAEVRGVPRVSAADPASITYPLANAGRRIPGFSQLLPTDVSQTTGKELTAEHPGVRALTGVGGAPIDYIAEEARRIGLPGQSLYIRETGDLGLDRAVAETYARFLNQIMPPILQDPAYTQLRTPARQRDFLQRYVLPDVKRAALAQVQQDLGTERFEGAMVRGEEARRRLRVERMLEELGGGPDTPTDAPAVEGPPPPPF